MPATTATANKPSVVIPGQCSNGFFMLLFVTKRSADHSNIAVFPGRRVGYAGGAAATMPRRRASTASCGVDDSKKGERHGSETRARDGRRDDRQRSVRPAADRGRVP